MSQTDIANLVLKVDSGQVDKATGDLGKFSAAGRQAESAAKNLGTANAGAAAKFREQAEAIATLQGPLGGVSSRFSSLGGLIGNIGPVGAAAAVVFTALASAAEQAVSKFAALEQQQITIASVLRATNSSSAQTTASIEELVASISHTTLATDTQVRQAVATMLTFRSVTGATFTDAIKLSQDLAAIGFGDINSAARALGRALEDPKQGLQALRREGIIFTQAQQLQITNFLEAGRVADAQKVILDRVRASVGGAGDAQAVGLTGATHALNQATEDLLQQWGKQISEGTRLAGVIRAIADAAQHTSDIAGKNSTPEGKLAQSQADLAELERHQADTGPFGPSSRQRADNSKQIAALQAEIDAQQQLVEARKQAKAQGDLIVANNAYEEKLNRERDVIAGVSAAITKETELLRMNDLQRAITLAQRQAQVAATSRQGQAIADLVKARFQLQQGVQQEQPRLGVFGDASPKQQAELKAANKEARFVRADFPRKEETQNDRDQYHMLAAA